MKKKNLVVALTILIITNVLSLFIIIKQRTGQISLDGLNLDRTNNSIIDQTEHETLKKQLVSLYKPSPQSCGAAVRVSKSPRFVGTARFDLACLIQGTRKIAWETKQKLKNEYGWEYSLFESLFQLEGIQEIDGVSYRPEGKRDALLFIKHDLISNQTEEFNPYLNGILLGYDKNDIEFLHQRGPFNQWLKEQKKVDENFYPPFSYAEFSPEFKKQFEQYKLEEWPKDSAHYERDKKRAFEWLDENKKFTDQELYAHIQELKKNEKKKLR